MIKTNIGRNITILKSELTKQSLFIHCKDQYGEILEGCTIFSAILHHF